MRVSAFLVVTFLLLELDMKVNLFCRQSMKYKAKNAALIAYIRLYIGYGKYFHIYQRKEE